MPFALCKWSTTRRPCLQEGYALFFITDVLCLPSERRESHFGKNTVCYVLDAALSECNLVCLNLHRWNIYITLWIHCPYLLHSIYCHFLYWYYIHEWEDWFHRNCILKNTVKDDNVQQIEPCREKTAFAYVKSIGVYYSDIPQADHNPFLVLLSVIFSFQIQRFDSLPYLYGYAGWYVSVLVGNSNYWLSHDPAQVKAITTAGQLHT